MSNVLTSLSSETSENSEEDDVEWRIDGQNRRIIWLSGQKHIAPGGNTRQCIDDCGVLLGPSRNVISQLTSTGVVTMLTLRVIADLLLHGRRGQQHRTFTQQVMNPQVPKDTR